MKRKDTKTHTDALVAGALYDFVGYLTTHPDELVLGSKHPPYDIHELLLSWAASRGLDLHGLEADVLGWSHRLAEIRKERATW